MSHFSGCRLFEDNSVVLLRWFVLDLILMLLYVLDTWLVLILVHALGEAEPERRVWFKMVQAVCNVAPTCSSLFRNTSGILLRNRYSNEFRSAGMPKWVPKCSLRSSSFQAIAFYKVHDDHPSNVAHGQALPSHQAQIFEIPFCRNGSCQPGWQGYCEPSQSWWSLSRWTMGLWPMGSCSSKDSGFMSFMWRPPVPKMFHTQAPGHWLCLPVCRHLLCLLDAWSKCKHQLVCRISCIILVVVDAPRTMITYAFAIAIRELTEDTEASPWCGWKA